MGDGVRPPHERLRDNARLFAERNAEYGANYMNWGATMAAMYPSGLTVRSPQEWLRLCLQVVRVMKETRYASNFVRGGHEDSMDDLSVYAMMAAEIDELDRQNRRVVVENSHKNSEPRIGHRRVANGVSERYTVDSHGNGYWCADIPGLVFAEHIQDRAGPPTPHPEPEPEPVTALTPPHTVPIEELRAQLGPVGAVLGQGAA